MASKPSTYEAQVVSVIMPVYNSARFLRGSIDAVLEQSYSQLELIIVYDESKDDTLQIAREYEARDDRVRVIENQIKLGVSAARNEGIHAANGKYIAFADSDDVWVRDKLERQLILMHEKDADMVYASYDFINENGMSFNRPYIVPDRTEFKAILTENVIGTSTVLLTAECLKGHEFRTDFYQEDYVLWLELLRNGAVAAFGDPDVLVHYRISEGARSYNKLRTMRCRWIVYRKYLDYSIVESIPLWIRYCIRGIQKYAFVRVKNEVGGGTPWALGNGFTAIRLGWSYANGACGASL